MDDLSSIVGIIMAIIFVIVGFLRKKNKPNQQTKKTSDIFESVLGGFEEQYESEMPNNSFKERIAQARQDNHKATKPQENKTFNVPDIPNHIKPKTEHKKKKHRFDLRQAVIYSEIMNRKY